MNNKSLRQQFLEEGYMVFPGILEGKELERVRNACNDVLGQFTDEHDRKSKAAGEYPKDFISMRHLNDLRWHKKGMDNFKMIMEITADPRCLGPVEQIFGEPSLFRTISYFVNPRFESTEGNWHRDCQFGHTEEEERKILNNYRLSQKENLKAGIQFQIPLVDSDEIEYVPYSSGRSDSPEEYYFRLADNKSHSRDREGMPNAQRFYLKAGDGVIFNPNGIHRGRYYTHKLRRTLMLTYTPRSYEVCDQFSHQPWFETPGYLDPLSKRAQVYFEEFTEAYRDFWKSKSETVQVAAMA